MLVTATSRVEACARQAFTFVLQQQLFVELMPAQYIQLYTAHEALLYMLQAISCKLYILLICTHLVTALSRMTSTHTAQMQIGWTASSDTHLFQGKTAAGQVSSPDPACTWLHTATLLLMVPAPHTTL